MHFPLPNWCANQDTPNSIFTPQFTPEVGKAGIQEALKSLISSYLAPLKHMCIHTANMPVTLGQHEVPKFHFPRLLITCRTQTLRVLAQQISSVYCPFHRFSPSSSSISPPLSPSYFTLLSFIIRLLLFCYQSVFSLLFFYPGLLCPRFCQSSPNHFPFLDRYTQTPSKYQAPVECIVNEACVHYNIYKWMHGNVQN